MCWQQLIAVVILGWILCVVLVASTYCRGKFDVYRVCPMAYGSVLSTENDTQSVKLCSHVCMSSEDCRSWMYDPGTKVCETNSRTEKVTSFPGGCGSNLFFGKLEKVCMVCVASCVWLFLTNLTIPTLSCNYCKILVVFQTGSCLRFNLSLAHVYRGSLL